MANAFLPLARRATALLLSASVLAACQGGSASAPRIYSGVAPPSFSATSVDNASPMALTPIYVKTKGFSLTQPVTATFTAASGFTATLKAVRVEADGTVVVPVPLPMDPKTGVTGAAAVSMVLKQQNQSTQPVTLAIQDLPQLSDFGTNLGVVSRTYYNYLEMALGQQLGELRAVQASPINHVDTTKEQSDVAKLLQSVIRSRNDIDRIVANNATVISAGSVNGHPVNFDRNALTMMDRVVGVYLLNMGPVYQPPGASTSQHSRSTAGASNKRRPSSIATVMQSSLSWLEKINDAVGPAASIRSATNADNSLDAALSWAEAAAQTVVLGSAALALVGISVPAAAVTAAVTIGTGLAAFAVGVDLAHIGGDIYSVIEADTPQERSDAYASLANNTVGALVDGAGVVLGEIGGTAVFSELSTGAQFGLQSTTLIGTAIQQYELQSPEQEQATSESAAAQFTSPSIPSGDGFAQVDGNFAFGNGQGPILSGLGGVQIGQPPFTYGLADPSGNYDLVVPTGSPFDTSGLSVTGFDPISGTTLSSVPLDLSGLQPGAVVKAPAMSGTCNDTDAGNPDSDDPDCD